MFLAGKIRLVMNKSAQEKSRYKVTNWGAMGLEVPSYTQMQRRSEQITIEIRRNIALGKNGDPYMQQRDEATRQIKKLGRKEWKKESGYHIRSLSETNMYRYKITFGDKLRARSPKTETAEVKIKCKILNQFIGIGMPKSEKIAA